MRFKYCGVFFVMLSILTICLFSCTDNSVDNDNLTIISEGKTEYTLICADVASQEIVSASIYINKQAYDKSGVRLQIKTDITSAEDNDGKEIIIGETNRKFSNIVKPDNPNDYIIAVSGESVVLLGGSDKATVKACEYFCENILFEKTPLPQDFFYYYEHRRIKLSIAGTNPEAFYVYGEDVSPEIIADIGRALTERTGKPILNSADPSAVSVHVFSDTSIPSNTIRLTSENGVLQIISYSRVGYSQLADVLRTEFDKHISLDFPNGYNLDFECPVIPYNELPSDTVPYFTCQTNKDPLSYQIGDEIIFDISLNTENNGIVSAPLFYYSISSDFNPQVQSGLLDGSMGKIQIKTKMDNPGFVKLYVAVASETGVEVKGIVPFNGGVGVAIDQITQSVSEPEDFDEFWQNELAKLDEIEPEMTIVNDLSENFPGFKVYDVRIDCVDAPVSGYISMPENAEPNSLNILVGYTGYGVVSPMPSVRANSIVFAVNAHSIENGREDEYYSALSRDTLYSYGFNWLENINRDTVYFKNMILRDVQAVRYLMTLPEWNGNSISLNGGSQGAFQAIAVAALVPETTYLYIANTWMCDLGSEAVGRLAGWRPDYTDALRYYDSVNFAKRIKCYTTVDAGLGDYVTPPSGIIAMKNSMKVPYKFNFYQGMTHYYTPENVTLSVLTNN